VGLAGAGFGASNALEDIVAQRLKAQMLQAEIANREQQAAMEQQQIDQRAREFGVESGQRQQQIDMQAGDRRARANDTGVRRMISESLMQGGTPDRKALAAMQIEAGDAPTMLNEPKPERDPIADYEARKKIDQRFAGQPKPERPVVHNVGGKLVDSTGKVIYDGGNPQGVDASKAREKGTSMLGAAKSLRSHPGLQSLTGARIGNPAYALGVAEEPVAGSQAADAAPFFNQLKSLFTLDNIGMLKGVLSDSDMKLLAAAGSSLDTKMQDATFVAELDKVIQKLESAFGDGGQASAMPPMQPTSSRGTGPAPSSRVDDLIKKYGGGGV
jgi:hypothetical protein